MSKQKRIIVDKREQASKVPRHLKALGVKVEYRILAIGDYITASGYAVERKEAHDFVSSLFSGRLFDQAQRLSDVYDNAALIVEGRFQTIFGSMTNPRAMWGTILSLAFDYGIRVFFTLDAEQTADFLYTLIMRTTSKRGHPPVFKGFRIRTAKEIRIAILSNLPGIGPVLAMRLLEHFGTLRKIFLASDAELSLVKGVSRVRASKIGGIMDAALERGKDDVQAKLRS